VAQVLLVDRDAAVRVRIAGALRDAGHDVETATVLDGRPRADLVISDGPLDLGRSPALLLVMSNDASEDARVTAFESGADDYVLKPFSLRELVLRVRALLRRARAATPLDVIEIGSLRIDRQALRVWIDGEQALLTSLEIRLLIFLAENSVRAVTREMLLESVWEDMNLDVRVVDTSIRRLRGKLGSARELLRTLRNVGYQLRA
jgi:two-component system phosphate regulon response regulator PhoB